MYMALHDQEIDSSSALIPAAGAPHTTIPVLEESRGDHNILCPSRKVRRTEAGRCSQYYYSEDELETADALVLLSLGSGGRCVSSTPDSTSDIHSGDIESDTSETPPVAISISRDETNPLLLRIKVRPQAKQSAYKCDTCGREFASPQALGGHKTSHRPSRPNTVIPDLNAPLRVFECSICGDVYYSGPALGGHKRKHYSPHNHAH